MSTDSSHTPADTPVFRSVWICRDCRRFMPKTKMYSKFMCTYCHEDIMKDVKKSLLRSEEALSIICKSRMSVFESEDKNKAKCNGFLKD